MDITVAGGEVVVVVRGELDVYTAPRLHQRLVGLIAEGNSGVTVDLAELDFIDSTGLSVLLSALKRLRQREGELRLRSPTSSTYKLLEMTGLTKVFSIT